MTDTPDLPHVVDVVSVLVNAQFADGIKVIQTAQSIHDTILVPCPLPFDAPIFDYYPPLREMTRARPLAMTPEVQDFVEQLPLSPVTSPSKDDELFSARARLIQAYQRALLRRADQMTQNETRIDAPFPPMTIEEYQERVAFVVERARAIPIEQTVDWWADVTCGVALTSPSMEALVALTTAQANGTLVFRHINSWRQIGYIVESLVR